MDECTGMFAKPVEDDQAENKPEGADDQAAHQQAAAADAAQKGHRVEIGQLEVGFACRLPAP